MSLEGWKAFFEIGGVVLLLLTFAFGAGALIVNNRLNKIQAKELEAFRIKFEAEQQKTALAQKEAAEAKQIASGFERDISAANQRAAEANVKAEAFRLDIAKANEGAARATETAERERLARLQLEARLADRTLTPAQQAHIAAALRVIGPRRIDVLIVGNTPEISRITNAVTAAVGQAGWTIGNMGSAMGGSAAGILVGTHLGVAQDVNAAADSLVSLLREAGIVSDRIPQYNDDLPAALTGNWDTHNTAPIRIIVGTKP
jgi:hypothetical protein